MTDLRMIEFDEVHRLAPWPGLVDALAEAHLREKPLAGQYRLAQPREDGLPDMLILTPAWDRARALGVKIVTSFPDNPTQHQTTTVGSLYILLDPQTGKPRLLLDGEALIFRKTAADTALGARLLSRVDARRLLMLGAGALAPYVIDALRSVRPGIDEVRIWNRTPARAEALVEQCREQGVAASLCEDPESDQNWADIVAAATMATDPIVHGEALRPGTHVGLIGSFTAEMRESDDALLHRAEIFVDDYEIVEKSGEFTGPLARGVIGEADIRGDLFALCQKRCPIPGPDAITMFKNGGASHLDLVTAGFVVSNLSG